MKKTLLAALAIAGFAVATSAQAQSNYNTGDSILFFRSTLNTTNYSGAASSLLINLGSIGVAGSDYNGTRNFNSININLSGNDSIVSQTYGTNWWNNPNLRWGVIGSAWDNGNTDPFSYRIASVASPLNISMTERMALAADVDNARLGFTRGDASTGLINSTYRYSVVPNGYVLNTPSVEVVTETSPGVFTTNQVAQDNFIEYGDGTGIAAYDKSGFNGVFGGAISKEITTVTAMNLYAANNTLDEAATETGGIAGGSPVQFGTISVSGGVVSAVPEPSTYALFGFAALILIVAYRRANA